MGYALGMMVVVVDEEVGVLFLSLDDVGDNVLAKNQSRVATRKSNEAEAKVSTSIWQINWFIPKGQRRGLSLRISLFIMLHL